MSRLTDLLPEVIEIDKRIEKAREQESMIASKNAKAWATYRAERAKWESAAVAAELDGKEVKPPPSPPDERARDLVIANLRSEIEADIKERRRAIVRASDTIREQVAQEVTKVLHEAAGPVDELHELVGAMRSAFAAMEDLTDAKQALDPMQTTRMRRPPVVDLAALVSAVKHGPDALLASWNKPKARVLGVQEGSTLGTPAVETREPPPSEPSEQIRQTRTSKGAEL